ncbi:MAG: arsenate reductase ArsC [Sulfurovum sp.]
MLSRVLVMCTGNSCRSIIGEALINHYLDGVEAFSCGIAPLGKVNFNAKKMLKERGIWLDSYHSKHLDSLSHISFDLVVTVCDNAKESCPIFPKDTATIHIGFVDPDGKGYEAFVETYNEIKEVLLLQIKERIGEIK